MSKKLSSFSTRASDLIFNQIIGAKKIMLTGGRSSRSICKSLANKIHLHKSLDIFLTDERIVPKNSPDSNYNMVKNELKINESDGNIRLFDMIDRSSMANESESFKLSNKYFTTIPEEIDFMLLSIGDDGHIGSIFSNGCQKKINENFLFERKAPKLPHLRFSISLEFIKRTKKIFLLIEGVEKGRCVKSFLENYHTNNDSFLQVLLTHTWLFDDEAMQEINKEKQSHLLKDTTCIKF